MERCHWIRAARQNPTTTISVEVGKEVAALEYGVHALDGADADAGGGVDLIALLALDSERVANVPACRLRQPVDIPLACCSGCGAKTSPFCYLLNLRILGWASELYRLRPPINSPNSNPWFTRRAPQESVLPSRSGKRIDRAGSANPYPH